MEKRTIRVYKPCEYCEGTGLIEDGAGTWDCRVCSGYGEVLENVYKDVKLDGRELPSGR